MSKPEKPSEARPNRDETAKAQLAAGGESTGASSAGTPQSGMKPTVRSSGVRRDWLARGLRQLYDKALQDPIPQSFQDLLDKLDEKDRP